MDEHAILNRVLIIATFKLFPDSVALYYVNHFVQKFSLLEIHSALLHFVHSFILPSLPSFLPSFPLSFIRPSLHRASSLPVVWSLISVLTVSCSSWVRPSVFPLVCQSTGTSFCPLIRPFFFVRSFVLPVVRSSPKQYCMNVHAYTSICMHVSITGCSNQICNFVVATSITAHLGRWLHTKWCPFY